VRLDRRADGVMQPPATSKSDDELPAMTSISCSTVMAGSRFLPAATVRDGVAVPRGIVGC